jgi:predicted RNase H-like nuclease (RuvC/YqgF family)
VTERIVARASRPEYVPPRDDRPSIDASESRVAELERELVYWRNRAIAEWAKSAERVRIAEASMGEAKKDVTLRKAQNRKLQAEITRLKKDVTRLKKRVAAFERRFGSRLRHKVGGILRRLGLR